MDIWYQSLKATLLLYRGFFQRSVYIRGKENLIPGPKIIIGNHANVTDPFVLPFLVKEKIHCFVQEEFFSVRVLGPLFKRADQIPVSHGRGREAIDTALDRLKRGNSVVIFPEGVLNHGRDFHRARTGAVILAAESGVPIVPIGFYVPDRFMRTFYSDHYNRRTVGRWQFGGPSYLQIGNPESIPDRLIQESNYKALRLAAERIMNYVGDLVNLARRDAGEYALSKP
jgi:1-acyl-sn-glycerol-3-phosphate acyltransferase